MDHGVGMWGVLASCGCRWLVYLQFSLKKLKTRSLAIQLLTNLSYISKKPYFVSDDLESLRLGLPLTMGTALKNADSQAMVDMSSLKSQLTQFHNPKLPFILLENSISAFHMHYLIVI